MSEVNLNKCQKYSPTSRHRNITLVQSFSNLFRFKALFASRACTKLYCCSENNVFLGEGKPSLDECIYARMKFFQYGKTLRSPKVSLSYDLSLPWTRRGSSFSLSFQFSVFTFQFSKTNLLRF